MGRKKPSDEAVFVVRLPVDQAQWVREHAAKAGISLGDVLRRLVAEGMEWDKFFHSARRRKDEEVR